MDRRFAARLVGPGLAVSYVGVRRGGCLVAFFACLYFAMLAPPKRSRSTPMTATCPSPAAARLDLNQTTPSVGKQWTDTRAGHEQRGL